MNKKETNQPKPAEEKVEKKQIEAEVSLEVEINRLKEEKLRLLADSENQRKNYQQTIEYIRNYSNKKIILWILDFLADLERALEFMRQEPESQARKHLPAFEMMKNNIVKNLEKEGVKEIKIEPQVDQLNSYYHEAISEVENDELPDGVILEVVNKGYLLHDQVLKASQVKVSKKKVDKK